jgi:hypothetical protein
VPRVEVSTGRQSSSTTVRTLSAREPTSGTAEARGAAPAPPRSAWTVIRLEPLDDLGQRGRRSGKRRTGWGADRVDWLTGTAASTANLYYESMHFAAMEVPDLLIGDVREFFRTLR